MLYRRSKPTNERDERKQYLLPELVVLAAQYVKSRPSREQSITAGLASGNIVAKVIPVVPAATPAVTVADIGSADILPPHIAVDPLRRLRGNKGHPMAALEKQKPRRGRVSMFDFVWTVSSTIRSIQDSFMQSQH
jgi:hypothetical protein